MNGPTPEQRHGNASKGRRNSRPLARGTGLWLCLSTIVTSAPGDLDPNFNPNVTGPSASSLSTPYVVGSAIQPDGKILISGGNFDKVQGVTRNNIARLGADGVPDPDFNPNATGPIVCLAVLENGRIVVGGSFSAIGGATRDRLAMIESNGAVVPDFNPAPNGAVACLTVQPDGMLLVGGSFSRLGTLDRRMIARIHANGTVDQDFNSGDSSGYLYASAVQSDGKIVVVGGISKVDGVARSNIARLLPNGRLDTGFTSSTNGDIRAVQIQPDGGILIGGQFTEVNGQARPRIARLQPNGTLDTSFAPNATQIVTSISLQADSKIVFSEALLSTSATTFSRIARVHSTGEEDDSFLNPGPSQVVSTISAQRDGALVLGGRFTTIGATTRNRCAKLLNSPASEELSAPSRGEVRWLRGGSSPEALQATLDLSTDGGQTWQEINGLARMAGGWQATGLNLPDTGHLRARARTSDGKGNSGLLETVEPFSFLPPNLPPVFAGFSASTRYQTAVSVQLRKILTRASDPEGGAVTLDAAGPLGSAGGSATLQENTLEYTPAAGFSGEETVTLTLADEQGTTTTAEITFHVAPETAAGPGSLATNAPRIRTLPGGGVEVSFQGIPGRIYQLQRSTNLNDWQAQGSSTAGTSGRIEFIDASPPEEPSVFYRLAIP